MAVAPDTVQISTQIFIQRGAGGSAIPAAGVRVKAELQSSAQNTNGYIIPEVSEFIVDENGDVTLELWPNNNGNTGTYYKIIAHDDRLDHFLEIFAIVPESAIPLRLEDIALPITTYDLNNASGSVPSCRLVLTAEGISGGGDLSTTRTHILDLETITPEMIEPEFTDIIAIQRPGSSTVNYVKLQNLPGAGFSISEEFVPSPGQDTFVTSTNIVIPEQVQVFIEGRKQLPSAYTIDVTTDTVILSEPLEGGAFGSPPEQVEIVIKQSADTVLSLDASNVSYGPTNVESALDTLFSASGFTPWQNITNIYTASNGDRLFIDVSLGPFAVTLPASPSFGDTITFIDISTPDADISINNLTVLRNGELIMGIADDLTVDEGNVSFSLVYAGPLKGWRIQE